jgi:hypothetical protein
MEKFAESLQNADKYLTNAEHIFNVTFKLVNDKKIFLNVIENLYKSVLYSIDSVLQLEFLLKRIKLAKDSNENLRIFKNLAERYGITKDELKITEDIFFIVKRHRQSSMEFLRGEKIVIMSESFPCYLDTTRVKAYSETARNIFNKIKGNFLSQKFI